MQLTKKELRNLINEEVERFSLQEGQVDSLVENFSESFEVDENNISKEAFINFLEIMNEQTVPKMAFDAFVRNLAEGSAATVLKESLDE